MLAFLRNRSDVVPVLTTLLVGSLLVAATRTAWPADACGPDEVAAQMRSQQGSAAITVSVLSSTNKSGVMAEMACRYERSTPSIGERPIDVVISAEASGSAFERIGSIKPTVWAPAATSWVRMLRVDHQDWVPDETPSIAQSPQVIAMPQPIATSLGWPGRSLGWSDIASFATEPGAWDTDMWGAFKLGKTNPRLSTSGLNSTVATFAAATGSSSNLSVPQLQEPSVLRFVHRVESAAVHYAPTSVDFLRNLRTQDELGNGEGYVSAILLEEKSVWDYNHGNPSGDPATLGQSPAPATPLVAFYPDDGALVADHPYVILGGDWVDEDQRAAANRFLDFLLEPAQQERFQSLGFRDHAGAPAAEISQDNGLIPSEPTATLTPPDGVVLQKIRETWPTYRKQARMLIVIDLSASMGNVAVGSDRTKLQLAQTAALQAIKELGPDDEVGLWTFSSSGQPYVEQVKIGRVSSNHDELVGAIRGLSADPGNPSELYATVTAALSALGEGFDETRINGMVLLSDGPNEGSSTVTSGEMLAAAGSSVDQEVRIFTIAYGDTADTDTLAELATASLGTAYGAQAPTDILRVFPQVVANF